jgi:hypothetical protein
VQTPSQPSQPARPLFWFSPSADARECRVTLTQKMEKPWDASHLHGFLFVRRRLHLVSAPRGRWE